MRILVASCVLALVALTACSSGDDSEGDSSAEGTPAQDQTDADTPSATCAELGGDEVADLAGIDLEGPLETDVGGLPACQWNAGDVQVQTIAVDASTWAAQLPELLDQLKASRLLGDDENRRKLEEGQDLIEAGGTIDPEQACGFFSQLLEVQGVAAGGERIVTLLPTKADPQAISAQACTGGRYASVLLAGPDLFGTDQEVGRVEGALDLLLSRG